MDQGESKDMYSTVLAQGVRDVEIILKLVKYQVHDKKIGFKTMIRLGKDVFGFEKICKLLNIQLVFSKEDMVYNFQNMWSISFSSKSEVMIWRAVQLWINTCCVDSQGEEDLIAKMGFEALYRGYGNFSLVLKILPGLQTHRKRAFKKRAKFERIVVRIFSGEQIGQFHFFKMIKMIKWSKMTSEEAAAWIGLESIAYVMRNFGMGWDYTAYNDGEFQYLVKAYSSVFWNLFWNE